MAMIGYLGKDPDNGIPFIVSREVFRTPANMKWGGSARYATHERHVTHALTEFTGLDPDYFAFDMLLTAELGVDPTIDDDLQNQYDTTVEAIPVIFSGSGTASGKVTDALTGQGVTGLTLNIRKGIKVIAGDIVATVTTGSDGSYTTPTIEAGNYSVEIVDERALSGGDIRYLNSVFVIKVLGDHAIPNQNGYVTSSLQANQLHIVLKWGEQPRDLDPHLVGSAVDGEGFHVYYSDRNYEVNSTLMANLDLDDTGSYGPETTTIYEMAPGVYT